MDGAFNIWREHGLAQLYIDNSFATSTQLQEKPNLTSSHLFRYFQIRNFIRKQFSNFPFLPNKNILDDILDFHTCVKGLCYCILSGLVQNCQIFGEKSSVIFSLPTDPNPVTALFGILPESVQLNTLKADSVAFCIATLLARQLIPMIWQSAAPPP